MCVDQSSATLHASTSVPADPQAARADLASLEQRPRYTEFIGHQYQELHELKRLYNKMIFQAPTILVTILGLGVALANNVGTTSKSNSSLEGLWPSIGFGLGLFAFLLSYWAYRTRTLLMVIEKALSEFDATFGSIPLVIYPFQLRKAREVRQSGRWVRKWRLMISTVSSLQHSTVLVIVFMFVVSYIIIIVSSYFLSVQLTHFWRG